MAIESINPATEEVIATFDEATPEDVARVLAEVASAFPRWRERSFAERGEGMRQVAAALRAGQADFARLITLEMGKPIAQAEAEIEKCAWACEFYAERAAEFLADEGVPTGARDSYVAYQPLGVVLAVMPWNFPFWQVFRFAAPALMAGNVAVLKHASNVPRCALAIERLFAEAGLPPGVLRALLVPGRAVDALIADRRIAAVTLTGSDATGAKVAEAAGRQLKKTVLELGGSDPFIVLEDADLAAAAEVGARARFQNTGQSCIAAKRFIVVDEVAGEFERHFVEAVDRLAVGDPLARETAVGPLARDDLRDQLERQVRESVAQGARVLLGGERLAGRGYYYAPTVLSGVTPAMPAWREETFGPAAALVRARDADEAIVLANDSPYGLGANLWTGDLDRARRLARRIEAGFVAINGMVASDPRLPFGGVKRSGYGRELGEIGIREFVNVQTVWISPAESSQPGQPGRQARAATTAAVGAPAE